MMRMDVQELEKLKTAPKCGKKLTSYLFVLGALYKKAYIVSRKPKFNGAVRLLIEDA